MQLAESSRFDLGPGLVGELVVGWPVPERSGLFEAQSRPLCVAQKCLVDKALVVDCVDRGFQLIAGRIGHEILGADHPPQATDRRAERTR